MAYIVKHHGRWWIGAKWRRKRTEFLVDDPNRQHHARWDADSGHKVDARHAGATLSHADMLFDWRLLHFVLAGLRPAEIVALRWRDLDGIAGSLPRRLEMRNRPQAQLEQHKRKK